MAVLREMVLYYQPEKEKKAGNTTKAAKMKGVLVRMGIRIKNIQAEQVVQTIGYLAGYEGYEESSGEDTLPILDEEVLVMKNFSDSRLDELLMNLKRAGVPKINLKAMITESNRSWKFDDLYLELKKEHETMSKKDES